MKSCLGPGTRYQVSPTLLGRWHRWVTVIALLWFSRYVKGSRRVRRYIAGMCHSIHFFLLVALIIINTYKSQRQQSKIDCDDRFASHNFCPKRLAFWIASARNTTPYPPCDQACQSFWTGIVWRESVAIPTQINDFCGLGSKDRSRSKNEVMKSYVVVSIYTLSCASIHFLLSKFTNTIGISSKYSIQFHIFSDIVAPISLFRVSSFHSHRYGHSHTAAATATPTATVTATATPRPRPEPQSQPQPGFDNSIRRLQYN